MNNHRRRQQALEWLVLLSATIGISTLALKFSHAWQTQQINQTDQYVVLLSIFFLLAIYGMGHVKQMVTQRNLPWVEELPDGTYRILQTFNQYNRVYYVVQATNHEPWLVEASQPLLLGQWRNQNRLIGRFKVSQGVAHPCYGSPT